jgi:hypothetical protein
VFNELYFAFFMKMKPRHTRHPGKPLAHFPVGNLSATNKGETSTESWLMMTLRAWHCFALF